MITMTPITVRALANGEWIPLPDYPHFPAGFDFSQLRSIEFIEEKPVDVPVRFEWKTA